MSDWGLSWAHKALSQVYHYFWDNRFKFWLRFDGNKCKSHTKKLLLLSFITWASRNRSFPQHALSRSLKKSSSISKPNTWNSSPTISTQFSITFFLTVYTKVTFKFDVLCVNVWEISAALYIALIIYNISKALHSKIKNWHETYNSHYWSWFVWVSVSSRYDTITRNTDCERSRVTPLGPSCHCRQLHWVYKFMKIMQVKKYTCKVHTAVLYI